MKSSVIGTRNVFIDELISYMNDEKLLEKIDKHDVINGDFNKEIIIYYLLRNYDHDRLIHLLEFIKNDKEYSYLEDYMWCLGCYYLPQGYIECFNNVVIKLLVNITIPDLAEFIYDEIQGYFKIGIRSIQGGAMNVLSSMTHRVKCEEGVCA